LIGTVCTRGTLGTKARRAPAKCPKILVSSPWALFRDALHGSHTWVWDVLGHGGLGLGGGPMPWATLGLPRPMVMSAHPYVMAYFPESLGMRQGSPRKRRQPLGTWLNLRVLSSESSPIRLEIKYDQFRWPADSEPRRGLPLGFGSVSN